MKEWLENGIHQVNALLGGNSDFRDLLNQLEIARMGYHEAISTLPECHREQIENYIALCEEIEYQKTLTAYYCGKQTD